MINANFGIELPIDNFKNIYNKFGKTPFSHKFWEFQIYKDNVLFGFNFDYTIRGDHAGVRMIVSLLCISIEFNFYDSRHWDYANNKWMDYQHD